MESLSWRTGGMSKTFSFLLLFFLVSYSFAKELVYNGNPFLLNASYKASNIIILPENVKSAYSSTSGVKVDFVEGSNKLIVVIPNKPSDLVVEGESGTLYIFNLNPMALPSQIFKVKNQKIKKLKAKLFEAKNPIEDTISNIIKAVVLNKAPEGYDKKPFSKVIAGKDVIVIGKSIYEGGSFKVYVADIVNRTNKTLRLREDSQFALKLAKKLANANYSDVRAIAINKEILKPKKTGKDWYATYYLIVSNRSNPITLQSFYEGK